MQFKEIIRENIKQLLFAFFAFFFMVLVSCIFVSIIVERQVRSSNEEVFYLAEGKLHAMLREEEIVLLNAIHVVEENLDGGDSPADIQAFLAGLLRRLTLPENSIPGLMNIQGFIGGVYVDGLGRPPGDYAPRNCPWYAGALETPGQTAISGPHAENQSGSPGIFLSRTLGGTGETYGALAVSIDMAVIADYVKSLQFAQGGYGMMLNQDLVFLVHPDDSVINTPMTELSAGHAEIARKLREGQTGIFSSRRLINTQGVQVVIAFRRIFTGWFLGIATPVSSYYRNVYFMALALSLLGLIFMSVLSFFLIRLDMERRRSDEENKSKSSFLARMSHEIRTPMNSILGMAELIMRKDISLEIREYISIISQSGHTLLAIINDILDFSKITSGKFRIEPRPYRFSSLINDTVNVIRMRILEKPVDFVVNVDGNIPANLIGDDVRVRQILINLLGNAVKYTAKGHVLLNIQKGAVVNNRLSLIMSVTDTGIGIKEENLKYLFSDFSRLEAGGSQNVEGTGLGLAITDTLCRAMDGTVTVTSEYGKGSTFTAVIVQSFQDDEKLAWVNRSAEKRVLLFEDRPHYLRSLVQTFTNLGVVPACSPGLGEFTAELAKNNFDYAFISSRYAMDCIQVPGESGSPIQLVIMVEPGDVSVFREVSSIMMPVYSVSAANVLNGTAGGEYAQYLQPRFDFTAPTASVLIVDDISSNLRVAKELMSPYRMDVQTCQSGAEAVNMVKRRRYDIIFMDHMMPGMDGLEAAAAIRAWEKENPPEQPKESPGPFPQETPIVALTANAISGQKEMFLQKGLNDFIAKPIEVKRLNAVLERWIPREKKIKTPPPEAGEAGEKPAELPPIPGVDIRMGLRNVNGSVDVYLDILAEFCQNMEDLQIRMGNAREGGDAGLFADSLHALKGAARGVGALELGNFAEETEKAVRRGDKGIIEERIDVLLRDMQKLANSIRTAAAAFRAGAKVQEPVDLSALQLETLKEALITMDITAANKLLAGYMSMPMDGGLRETVSEIERHVLMFEYDEAVKKIDSLLSGTR
ncbi:MAG: response regulator [Treponema sp.]|jgi:signal transduction histidine kinase/CheY-like chemotaxis protein/HPt (histidine-containing phosphotransfer) domain-containing protein|nr:response regulator [Treponema sp.]